MGKEYTITQMVIYIMDLGLMIKNKDKEPWKLQIKIFTQVNGNNLNMMDMEIINIFMERNTEEITKTVLEKEKENYLTLMEVFMKVIFKKILLMVMVK